MAYLLSKWTLRRRTISLRPLRGWRPNRHRSSISKAATTWATAAERKCPASMMKTNHIGTCRGYVRNRRRKSRRGLTFVRVVRDLRGGVLAAEPEPVAVAVHLQYVDVVDEEVQQGSGKAFRTEDLGPLVEWEVGGDRDGAPLAALDEDLERESALVGKGGRSLAPPLPSCVRGDIRVPHFLTDDAVNGSPRHFSPTVAAVKTGAQYLTVTPSMSTWRSNGSTAS